MKCLSRLLPTGAVLLFLLSLIACTPSGSNNPEILKDQNTSGTPPSGGEGTQNPPPGDGSNSSGSGSASGGSGSSGLGSGDSGPGTAGPGEAKFLALASGGDHNCLLMKEGKIRCWGANEYGELGNGATDDWASPVKVMVSAGKELKGAKAVRTGVGFSCAILGDDTVACWGYNEYNKLGGQGLKDHEVYPVPVKDLNNVKGLSLGRYHACAVEKGGEVKCWGYNGFGQLGSGKIDDDHPYYDQLYPTAVNDLGDAKAVAAGGEHTCAILKNGKVKCWGDHSMGELGSGQIEPSNTATPTLVKGLTDAQMVVAGDTFACALLGDKTVWCWGNNGSGQLGNNKQESPEREPYKVVGISTAIGLSAGWYHACAVLEDGGVRCWGGNENGQLGQPLPKENGVRPKQSYVPVAAEGISNATAVAAAYFHSCALLKEDKVVCWGRNTSNQLGTGKITPDMSFTPVEVKF